MNFRRICFRAARKAARKAAREAPRKKPTNKNIKKKVNYIEGIPEADFYIPHPQKSEISEEEHVAFRYFMKNEIANICRSIDIKYKPDYIFVALLILSILFFFFQFFIIFFILLAFLYFWVTSFYFYSKINVLKCSKWVYVELIKSSHKEHFKDERQRILYILENTKSSVIEIFKSK